MYLLSYRELDPPEGRYKYRTNESFLYYSPRYHKKITIPKDYPSDGATGAFDIKSNSWWVHDRMCDTGVWDDGTKCTNWEASMVIADILEQEERYFRAVYWKYLTFAFGGGKARDNGMFKLKEGE